MPWNSLCRSGWPRTLRDPPASASQVLGLKACTIIPRKSTLSYCFTLISTLGIFVHTAAVEEREMLHYWRTSPGSLCVLFWYVKSFHYLLEIFLYPYFAFYETTLAKRLKYLVTTWWRQTSLHLSSARLARSKTIVVFVLVEPICYKTFLLC